VLSPICLNANQNFREGRQDVELQDTYVFSDVLRMVNGFGLRHDVGTSEMMLGGSYGNNSVRAFTNIEYKPTGWLNINVGGFGEKDQLTGFTFSPRIAANLRPSDSHSGNTPAE
jgi:iron complex outermembrane receptor protein